MANVKIYKVTCTRGFVASLEQGAGFSLEPWGNNTVDYDGYDDGGTSYTLPDGYDIDCDSYGVPHIYNADGNYCALVEVNGNPAIVTGNPLPIILKREVMTA